MQAGLVRIKVNLSGIFTLNGCFSSPCPARLPFPANPAWYPGDKKGSWVATD